MNGKINIYGDADVLFAVYKDNKYSEEIPEKGSGYSFQKADCTNGAVAKWDYSEWGVKVTSLNKTKTKCSLYFVQGGTNIEQSGESKMEDLLSQEEDKVSGITIVSDNNNNIRYIGADPSNYVKFNCDESGSCETWRIIGLMDGIKTTSGKTERLLKIIRETLTDASGKIKYLSWDSSDSNVNKGYGVNEWSQADLMTVLNGDYFKGQKGTDKCYNGTGESTTECPDWSQVGLKQNARDMIEEVVWNTGTASGIETTWQKANLPLVQYVWERSNFIGKQCTQGGSSCNDKIDRKTIWEGKVGLMYPSDYGIATDGGGDQVKRMQCLNTLLYDWYNNSNCYSNDWLSDSSNDQWTMTPAPYSSDASDVFIVGSGHSVSSSFAKNNKTVRPVVYLKSNVKISGGTGEEKSPFILSLEE